MSRPQNYYSKQLRRAFDGRDLRTMSEEDLRQMVRDILEDGLHGICFSAYEEGQEPGTILTEEQIRRRMAIIAPHIKWVRSFSCIEGNELIPKIAKEFGLKTLVGAWLGDDKELIEEEIAGLIKLTNEGYVDIAAVGNEVMYRKEMSEEELVQYIKRVKAAIPDTPVGYVDAYYEFSVRPAITEVCDVILSNCYPYWEGSHVDYALIHAKQMYLSAKSAGWGKKVIVTETGWPSQGTGLDDAQPSWINSARYFINMQEWSKKEGIEMFYFTSFDESWKVGDEGDVGAYWGIWDKDEKLKF
ncbi:MAG: glycosyl hydrolase family 17 protein [Bacteroidota bacterium]